LKANVGFCIKLKEMIKIFLVFVAILPINILIYSQGLQQTVKSWPLGEKMKVEHLNDDLEVVKEEYFDPNGIKVASYLIDPVTKKYNGPFFDGTNKGTYNQGILTADNFRVILINNHQSEITISIKEGIVYGKAIKITYHGPFFSTKSSSAELRNIDGPGFIRYENYINKKHQEFLKERNIKDQHYFSRIYELNYDQNGLLHGDHFIDPNITMIFDHGECLGIMTYDGITGINEFDDNHNFIGVKGYALDSVFRDQKVWKRNFKLIKNCGFIEGYTLPNIYNVDQLRLLSFNAYDYGGVDEKKIFTGQEVFKGQNYPALTFFNSDVSIVPDHIQAGWIETKRNDFLFEFRTAILDEYGFFYNEESSVISVFTPHNWSSKNYSNYHVDTIEHFKLIFALQNLHCSLINLGTEYFNDINFHKNRILRKGVRESDLITSCQGCTSYFRYDRSVSKSRWFDDEKMINECENWENMGYFDQTGYFVLEELHNKIKQKTRADEIAIKFFFIKKDLKKESDSRDEVEKIGLYSFDEVIDFSAIQEKNKEISENYEKEKQATKLKIDQICLNLTSGIESEHWNGLIDLSDALDSLKAISEEMGFDLSFDDPRIKMLKGEKTDFNAFVNHQILEKTRADYKILKDGLQKIASKLNLQYETNISTEGDLIDLYERIGIEGSSFPEYFSDIESRLVKMIKSINDNFEVTSAVELKTGFAKKEGDSGSLGFSLFFSVGKPKNDFIIDKTTLKQEWKLNSPKLMLMFSSNELNNIYFNYGNIRQNVDYYKL
jgi:hypothetical protein